MPVSLGRPYRQRRPTLGHAIGTVFAVMIAAVLAGEPMVANAQALRFIRDAEIEDLLADYSRPIFKVAGLASQQLKIRIVEDHNFNAFVVDGHNVFINSGALEESKTPNAIIGVLAHETGHIAGGHMAALRARVARDSSMALLMQILGMGAVVAGAINGGKSGTMAAGQSVLSATPDVTQRSILSYRRIQESSADQAGVKFLTESHQSAAGMLVIFRKFADDELLSNINPATYVSSHPMSRDRIAQLEELAKSTPYFDTKDPPELQLRHDLMRAKLIGFLETPQTVFNRYPSSDNSLPARYARSIAAFNSGGLDQALPVIDQLIRERPENPYFWEQKADFLAKRGQHAQAVAALRKALALRGNEPLMETELAQELLGSQDKKYLPEIVKLLRKALLDEETSDAYRQLATAYYGLGNEGEADLASAQAAVLEGNRREAKGFAKRAQKILPGGSQGWLKADDIIKIQDPSAE